MNDILGKVIDDSILDGIRELFFWLDNSNMVILRQDKVFRSERSSVYSLLSNIFILHTYK